MWRELIANLCPQAQFAGPVPEQELARAARELGSALPGDLVWLLRETDGVQAEYGLGLVWPIAQIVADNLLFRSSEDFKSLYMPFEPLLFFADAGNGDQFAFPRIPPRDEVFVWDHESDDRRWVAADLGQYLRGWLDGTITV